MWVLLGGPNVLRLAGWRLAIADKPTNAVLTGGFVVGPGSLWPAEAAWWACGVFNPLGVWLAVAWSVGMAEGGLVDGDPPRRGE